MIETDERIVGRSLGVGDADGASDEPALEQPSVERPLVVIRPPAALPLPDLCELWRYRDLLLLLARRNIAAMYRMSVLGVGWAVLRPVLMTGIFTVVFGFVASLDRTTGGIPYPLFALAGLVPWMYFQTSLTNATQSVVGSQDMLTKVYFPRLVLPLASLGVGLVELAIQCVILAAFMAAYGMTPTAGIAMLPLFFLLATAAALGGGIWLTALNVRYRDIHFALPFLTQAAMYLCPVIYPASLIPERWRPIYYLNPMAGVVEGFRWALFGSGEMQWGMVGLSAVATAVLLVSGLFYFTRTEQTFADVI